jgi:hypothetical protein
MQRALVIALLCLGGVASAQPVTSGGLRKVTHGVSLSGDGTVASPLSVRSDCADGEIIKWDAGSTAWLCSTDDTIGGAAITGAGTSGTIPKFTAADVIADSLLTDNATTLAYATNKFTVTAAAGNAAFAGTLSAAATSVTTLTASGAVTDTGNRVFSVAGDGLESSGATASVNVGSGIQIVADEVTFINTVIQSRVSGTCATGAVSAIASNGTVTCMTGSSDFSIAGDVLDLSTVITAPGSLTVATTLTQTAGEVALNVSSGNTCIGSTGCAYKLTVTGNALIRSGNVLQLNNAANTLAETIGYGASGIDITGLLTVAGGVTTPVNLTTTGTGDLVSADALTVAGTATLGDADTDGPHIVNGRLIMRPDVGTAAANVTMQLGNPSANNPHLGLAGYADGAAGAYVMHNAYAEYAAGGIATLKWDLTNGGFGSRLIRFDASSGILFYADAVATTAGSSFTPTLRMTIDNAGAVTIPGTFGVTGLITATGGITSTAATSTFGDLRGTVLAVGSVSGALDNWAPTGHATATHIVVTGTGAITLTGLQGGAAGRIVTITNAAAAGAADIQISHDTTSTGSNRFSMADAANWSLTTGTSATFIYNSTAQRWIHVGTRTFPSMFVTSFQGDSVTINTTLSSNGNTVLGSSSANTTTVNGSLNGYTQITQSADQDVTNLGLTDSNTFLITTAANKIYAIDAFIIAGGSDTTGDYIFDFAVAAGTMNCTGHEQSVTTADAIQNTTVIATAAADTADTSVGTRADASLPIAIRVTLACKVTNATTLKYRFGNAAAAGGRVSRTMAGSYIKWKVLN